jgi:hypothetical protein
MNPFPPAYIAKISEDVFAGTRPYFRDASLTTEIVCKYRPGLLIQETGHMDVSEMEGGLAASTRYMVYTNQRSQLQTSFAQYKCLTFPRGCYFKVLDMRRIDNQALVVLLHVPAYALPFFAVRSHPEEAVLQAQALQRFMDMREKPPQEELADPYWLRRTAFPLGIAVDGNYFYHFDYGDLQHLDPLHERKGFFRRLMGRRRGKT